MSYINNSFLAQHGALNYSELETLGIDPAQVIDFSANINPYGPIPPITDAVARADIKSYPDRDSLALRHAIADFYHIDIRQIMIGNGAAELIWLLCFSLLQPGDEVLVFGPTFGEYARCAHLMGAQITELNATTENHFYMDFDEINNTINSIHPSLVFLCNPNNPTGQLFQASKLLKIINNHPDIKFAIDEAYIDFTPQATSMIGKNFPNTIVLRSMTKYFALAGLRLGYIVAAPELIQILENVRPSWNVNTIAQNAGQAALHSKQLADKSLPTLLSDHENLLTQLTKIGFSPVPTSTHYFLLEVGHAQVVRQQILLDHHILVRDCASFGLPEYIRVSTRLPEENEQLVNALCRFIPTTGLG